MRPRKRGKLMTICECHRQLYCHMIDSGYSEDDEEIALLKKAYDIGKKMSTRLRQYKYNYDRGWYEKNKLAGPQINENMAKRDRKTG